MSIAIQQIIAHNYMNEPPLNNPKDGQLKMPFLLRPVILQTVPL